jgi:hypothetical protein
MGVGGQHHAPSAFISGKDPVPIVQEAGWASELAWIGAENLSPTGIQSPGLQARSESLYRLSHPGFFIFMSIYFYMTFLLSVCSDK